MNFDGFWMGNFEKKSYEEWVLGVCVEYFKFYMYSVCVVKLVDLMYCVGGFVIVGEVWIDEMFVFCVE